MDSHGGNIYKISKEYNIDKDDILDFSSNLNFITLSDRIKKNIMSNLNSIEQYPDIDYKELREKIAQVHSIDSKSIIPGNGAIELIYLYCRSIEITKALIIGPTFSEYEKALNSSNVESEYFELLEEDNFQLNLNQFKDHYSRNKYDLIIICNPNNPTGRIIGIDELKEISSIMKNTHLMIDESFLPFTSELEIDSMIPFVSENPHIFILRSLTKFYAIPGLRIGYGITSNDFLLKNMQERQEPWTINCFAESVVKEVIDDKDFISQSIARNNEERIFLFNGLLNVKWLKPFDSNVNFILLKITDGRKSSDIKERLLNYKILIRDVSNFRFLDDSFIRIAVKNRSANEKLLHALVAL